MDSRERVLRTLEFQSPDRLPVDIWVANTPFPAPPTAFIPRGRQLLSAAMRSLIS